LIDILYPLWTALASILCLQALFTLSTAFLHFYLFYILGIPFNHLVTPNRSNSDHHEDLEHEEKDADREDLVQKEVDIRARCERPPFEEYIWLWWAWWAFRRGPVRHVYGFVTGGLGLVAVSTFLWRVYE
jgi:predicted membrane metal-binding protein